MIPATAIADSAIDIAAKTPGDPIFKTNASVYASGI
jgi:hypothetical protein